MEIKIWKKRTTTMMLRRYIIISYVYSFKYRVKIYDLLIIFFRLL